MDSCPLNRFYSPAQCARYAQAIPRRYSCRAYAGALDAATLSALNYAAARVCLPGTRIVIADCPKDLFFGVPFAGKIQGAEKCAYIIASRELDRPLLYAGVSGEAFILEAASMGAGTCWVAGSFRRGRADVTLEKHETLVAVTPLGLPAQAQKLPHRRKSLAQLCLSEPAAWPLWAYRAAEAVRQAPSAMNLQPWRLSYGQRTLRLLGRPADRVDLGIAMLHMEAAVQESRRQWTWGEGKCVAHLTVDEEKP